MPAAILLVPLLLAQTPAPASPPAQETKAQKAERQHQEDLKHDRELGDKYAADVAKEMKFSKNQEYVDRVRHVGGTIAAIANKTPIVSLWGDKRLNPFDYHYDVIEGKDVNAFSLPGGHIYVYEGLMAQIESDDELAGVLAHETAHASLRHVATLQRQSNRMQSLTLPLVLLAILTGGASAAAGTLGVTSLVQQGIGSGWSVKAEEAADYGGFQYMLKSPYDPTGMLTFMEKLARRNVVQDSLNWGIYKSHPPSRERADTLIAEMNKAHVPIRRSKVAASLRTVCRDAVGGNVELVFSGRTLATFAGSDAKARASAAADRVNLFFDGGPEMFELKTGPDGTILGDNAPLFRVTPVDASSVNQTVPERQAETMKAMRFALYATGGRVWGQG